MTTYITTYWAFALRRTDLNVSHIHHSRYNRQNLQVRDWLFLETFDPHLHGLQMVLTVFPILKNAEPMVPGLSLDIARDVHALDPVNPGVGEAHDVVHHRPTTWEARRDMVPADPA